MRTLMDAHGCKGTCGTAFLIDASATYLVQYIRSIPGTDLYYWGWRVTCGTTPLINASATYLVRQYILYEAYQGPAYISGGGTVSLILVRRRYLRLRSCFTRDETSRQPQPRHNITISRLRNALFVIGWPNRVH